MVLAVGVGAAVAMSTAEAADGEPGQPQLTRGRELYTQNCAQCHGPQGSGSSLSGRTVPAIDDDPVSLVRVVMATGRMPPPGDPFDSRPREVTLAPDEREAILAYATEEFGLTGDVAPPPEGDAARGQDLYTTNCAACHGTAGGGGVAGRGAYTPALTGYEPQTIADAARTGPFAMPQFGRGQLSDQELGDIAAFLETVQQEEYTPLWDQELGPVYASAFAAALMGLVLVLVLVLAGRPMWFPPEHHDRAAGEERNEQHEPDEQDDG
jgi:ubiquinol-cytochrome c reductase cytochrome c subunit